ncbi:ATP-dependent Clp protease proteolytic subunit (plastid) [Bigelowiella natans]|uniref:ATP-dependent Clp protease proteolytic subunit n=1 Tax=Bigelowiella natans TaxID=227086 RepID=CLPP_BIGNA|nr:ATP-dependent Clp protease proteolytic subunit [Bigelowiella natans]Q06J25.1 RecName: Full=ATP-dependent Clp protease proteolytic subunit; AltName: Full=Endopeptidase Clp [Bigelowiella natans]ABG91434.1 ATP-dependent Clp protease proteolytic subunit [Bigelowiella natans]
MPIGIPKVLFKESTDTTPQWVDIYTRLYKDRIIFLFQLLDDDFSNQIISMLLHLDSESKEELIYFYINSVGGSVLSGISIYDTMNFINSEIVTLCIGIASSISSLILANGKRTKRFILPHSRVLLHQPIMQVSGQASDILIESEEILRLRRILTKIYIENIDQTISRVARDIDRDCFLSSREAKNYGIVDYILTN